MRVAYVCMDPGVPVWGNKGCSIHVQGILRALLRKDIDIDLIALRQGGDCPPGLQSVALHLVDRELPIERAKREQVLCQLNIDLQQLLVDLNRFDFVYERYALFSFAGVEFARDHGIPGLLEVNAPLINEQERHRVLLNRDRAVEATQRSFCAATAILPVSDELAVHVSNHNVSPDRIHVSPNAIDVEEFRRKPSAPVGASDETFTIGFVGSLKPWHGVAELISAYARLWEHGSGWRLIIVGDGPERSRLEAQVAGLPTHIASSIEFLGMVSHAAIPNTLAVMNAAVAPCVASSDEYFSPIKLFEYMAAALPVVAARYGQIRTLIQNGVTGLLYDPGDILQLANVLLRLRADPQVAAQLGERARHEVFAQHTWDHRGDTIVQIVRQSIVRQVEMAK
jgi:glycosyltransferase involved in cell wall biosynthesis